MALGRVGKGNGQGAAKIISRLSGWAAPKIICRQKLFWPGAQKPAHGLWGTKADGLDAIVANCALIKLTYNDFFTGMIYA
jgi:hypothetical protein